MRGLAALSVVLIAAPANAASVEDARGTARTLFNEGLDLRNAGDHVGAIAKFKAADATFPTPKIRLELARELVTLRRFVEARAVLASIPSLAVEPKDEGKYEGVRAEATALAIDLERRVPKLRITAPGARAIVIDGREASAGVVAVDPGRHVIVVRRDAKTDTREVDVAEGDDVTLRFDEPARASSARAIPTVSIGLFVVSGAALIAGGAFAWSARGTYDDSAPHCGVGGRANACDPEGLRLRSTAGTRADIATVAFIVAGVAAAGGILVWSWPTSSATKASVGLRVGPGALAFTGSF